MKQLSVHRSAERPVETAHHPSGRYDGTRDRERPPKVFWNRGPLNAPTKGYELVSRRLGECDKTNQCEELEPELDQEGCHGRAWKVLRDDSEGQWTEGTAA